MITKADMVFKEGLAPMNALTLKLGLFEDDGLLTETFVRLSFVEV